MVLSFSQKITLIYSLMLGMIEGIASIIYSLTLVTSILKEIIANGIMEILLQFIYCFLSY